ncbi:phospholipid transport system substrate-binding protein [Allopseudospirillum japonicum]|uniref:Phospholipid transport system substrate-binding protein n=1 Tax=Allopseudospirillum japonicum TaxID=64971 RepID=A0A1H6QLT4_9GAMM|nr:ABC transporter substrate-binding protein [Allopseudospirillum japonicum]SEI39942.1 phospholipid transport system substrate-binding protein [Allopseudospirillum japonicum]
MRLMNFHKVKMVLLLLLSTCWLPAYAQEAAEPRALVEAGVQEILSILDAHQAQAQSLETLYQQMSQGLEPYVDFRYISARVMGKYFRAATPEQRTAFAQVFQQSIVRTFTQGLIGFEYKTIKLLPALNQERRYPDQDMVDMQVETQSGQNYPLSFTLRKDKQGQWQIINLVVNGINLGLTFNSQFDQAMREQNRDFDAVIAGWNPAVNLDQAQD